MKNNKGLWLLAFGALLFTIIAALAGVWDAALAGVGLNHFDHGARALSLLPGIGDDTIGISN